MNEEEKRRESPFARLLGRVAPASGRLSISSRFHAMLEFARSIPRHPNRMNPSRVNPSHDRKGVGIIGAGNMDKQILRRKAPQDDTPPEHPPSLTPEQFRRMLDLSRRAVEETLAADPGLFLRAGAGPTLARRVLWPLAGTVFPFVGGACGAGQTPGKLVKFTSPNCGFGDSVVSEDSSGRIGIGTDTPAAKLAVAGDTYLLGNGGTSALEIRSAGIPTRRGIVLPADPNGQMIFYVHSFQNNPNFEVRNALDDSLLFRIKPGGFADVNGSNPRFILESSDANTSRRNLDLYGSGSSARWRLYKEEKGTDTTLEYLTVLSGGNVGIGTTNPADKLTVSEGRIRSEATGDVRNLVLNQLSGSLKRTQISFNHQGAEQYLVGTDLLGNVTHRNFFLYDSISGQPILLFLSPRGGSNDDAAQIQAAINALPANGGIIYLTPGTYNIGSTISIADKNGVKLRGYGGTWLGEITAPATRLKWNVSSTGTIIEMKSTNPNTQIEDLELSDVSIDGNGWATYGLKVDTVKGSVFRSLHISNMKLNGAVGILLTNHNGANGGPTLFNFFENCTVWAVSQGIVLEASPTTPFNDSTQNIFVNLAITYLGNAADAAGIWLKAADANVFIRTTIWRAGGSQGRGVVVEDPQLSQANYFYHLSPQGGFFVKNANKGPHVEGKNMIFGHTIGDPTEWPMPTTDDPINFPAKTVVAWITSMGDMWGFTVH